MTQTFKRGRLGLLSLTAVLALSLTGSPTIAADKSAGAMEKKTVNAFAPFEGQGKIFKTGETTGTFVGAIVGELFVETEKGPRHSGRITCPAMLEINLENGKQTGNGRCVITGTDGAQAFATWSCQGVHMLGCDGKLMLTGGTKRAAGISGSGPLTVRTTASGLIKSSADVDSVTTLGTGVLVLKGFKFEKPAK